LVWVWVRNVSQLSMWENGRRLGHDHLLGLTSAHSPWPTYLACSASPTHYIRCRSTTRAVILVLTTDRAPFCIVTLTYSKESSSSQQMRKFSRWSQICGISCRISRLVRPVRPQMKVGKGGITIGLDYSAVHGNADTREINSANEESPRGMYHVFCVGVSSRSNWQLPAKVNYIHTSK
jgi:hypothetical protein